MTFNDFKDVIDSLPVEIENLTEESRLVEDMGLDEEDCEYIFDMLQRILGFCFSEDDAFYRFAGHKPMKELVEMANMEHESVFD